MAAGRLKLLGHGSTGQPQPDGAPVGEQGVATLRSRQLPIPHVLHIDRDRGAGLALGCLLAPQARVTHVSSLADARRMLLQEIFPLVVLDPDLPDGDVRSLLPALVGTPLLLYCADRPAWRERVPHFLPKPSTPPRQLWAMITRMLGIVHPGRAGDWQPMRDRND